MLSMRQLMGRRLALLRMTAVIVRGSMSAWRYSGGDDSHLDVRCEEAPSREIAGGFVMIPHHLRFGQTVIQVRGRRYGRYNPGVQTTIVLFCRKVTTLTVFEVSNHRFTPAHQ